MTWKARLSAAAVAVAVVAGTGACAASASTNEPAGWVDTVATPLRAPGTGRPADPEHLQQVVGDAVVVGLGESAHGLGDQFTLRQAMARNLVENAGFRTLAFENDFANGADIDRYVLDGVGDPRAIVGSAVAAWRSEEMLDLVHWVREFNLAHPQDKVRFLGTDVTQLRRSSFDAVTRYVARVAPQRLAELRGHLEPIALRGSPGAQIMWFFRQPDQARIVEHARAARALVTDLPAPPADTDRDMAVQHARTITGFYENYTETDPNLRDRIMAETMTWWRQRTDHKIVYFAANVHVAAGPHVDYAFPPTVADATLVPAGHHLRRVYGTGYRAIAAVFGSGQVLQGWETGSPSVYSVPPPRPEFVDHTLGRATPATYLLDLRSPAPPGVRRWLDGPATMRVIGSAYDPAVDRDYSMHVESLTGSFDAITYIRTTNAAQRLG